MVRLLEGVGMKERLYKGKKNITGERVRMAREKKGLTQKALAAMLQTEQIVIDNNGVSKIERNMRSVTDFELKFIAKHLDVTMDWLADGEDS